MQNHSFVFQTRWKACKQFELFTCVFPPVLSWTALLERAVLAARDLNAPPKMLLAPKAMSSCAIICVIADVLPQTVVYCILNGILFRTYLISIYNVVVLYRIDFSYCKSHGKSHNSYWESLHCCHLENLQTRSDWGLKPKQMKMCLFFMPPTVLFS